MRNLFCTLLFGCLASLAWGQANVNEQLETASYWVDAGRGSDTNPGTQELPFKTLGVAAILAENNNHANIGTKINVNPGIYREFISFTATNQETDLPITIEAAQPGSAIMSGADVFTGWQPYSGNPSIYTTVWPYEYGLCAADTGGGPFEQDIVLRREMAFVNGKPLTQVLGLAQMQQASFFVDEGNALIYIWPANGTNVSSATVEVATRPILLSISNKNNVVVRGMTFQYSNACRTGSALPVVNSDNILLDNNSFLWNNAQGLGLTSDTLFTVQDSVASHNGQGGVGAYQSLNSLWTDNITEYNNWRGAQGAFYLWSGAAFHPYGNHQATISGLTSAFNQTFGIHWDTDNQNVAASGLILTENLLAEAFIEKSEGPISIIDSYMCGGNPTTGPVSLALELRNSQRVTLSGDTLANDAGELKVLGTPGGISVPDWQTGEVYNLITSGLVLNNNIFVGGSGQDLFDDSTLSGTDWIAFLTSLSSDYNTWWNPVYATPFTVPVPANYTQTDFPGRQALTLQDSHSTFSQPSGDYLAKCTLPPEAPDFWLVTDPLSGLQPISSGGAAKFVATAVAFGGFSGPISLSVDGVQNIAGATATWDAQIITTSGAATLTVTSGGSTPTGVYPVTITANNGALTRTLAGSVLVNTTLAVAPRVANLGAIGVGSTSLVFTVTLANVGIGLVSIAGISASGDFAQTNTCGAQLLGAAQCSISITFTPTAVGTRSGVLTVTDNDAGSPQKVTLTGLGTGVPVVNFSPVSLTFPNTDVYIASAPMSVTLTNAGSGALTINSIGLAGPNPGDFSQTNTCPPSLSAASSCVISVTFSPVAIGNRTATVSVSDNAATYPQTVPLTGTAVIPAVTLTPTSISFANQQVGTTSPGQSIILKNSGSGPLFITGIALTGNNPGDFAQANTCPATPNSLAANASCTITATFAPTVAGSRSAIVTFTDNALNSPQNVLLRGSGTAFTVTLAPSSLIFSSQVVGMQSYIKTVTLTNRGSTSLSIAGINFTGTNSAEYAQNNTCGPTVSPSGTCAINVSFTPTASGTRIATLQVADNGDGSPQTVSVTGTAVQPTVILSPTSLNFPIQQINTSSAGQRITLNNTGSGALTITGFTLGGTNAADFSQTNSCPVSPATLAVGKSCALNLIFKPKASGTRSASLIITDNAPGGSQNAGLTGIGTAVQLSPSSLAFSAQAIGHTSSTKTVTITNLGTSSLLITGIGVGGTNATDFAQTNTCGTSVAGGASCTLGVTFTPTGVGARTANVFINDNDPASPQTVTLSGTGT